MNHFEGKSVKEHLLEARKKGAIASMELHGTETPGYFSACTDAMRESAITFFLIWIIFQPTSCNPFLLFSFGWLIWKTGRSALLGWARLEKVHRLIEEERWEIEHNREEEKEELTALYRTKGLSGKLLEDTINVFMSDDNRLLRLMLEEEMGLSLEVYEHPLKQCTGAALGVILSSALFIGSFWIDHFIGPIVASFLLITSATLFSTKKEKNRLLEAVIWALSLSCFALLATYFLKQALAP